MTDFLIVEVESLSSSVPRSKFSEQDLDFFADRILDVGGLLKPLIVKKIGFEKYEVLDGHFEYYSALRAKEKNPHKGEIVNAFVIPSEKEGLALNQVAVITTLQSSEKNDIGELLQQNAQIYAKVNQILSNSTDSTAKPNHDQSLKLIENKLENISSSLATLTELVKELIPPPKLNLLIANEEQVKTALEEVGVSNKYRNAAWKAIIYWKQPGKTLSWENLKKSYGSSKEDKINDFGQGTYKKLKEIGKIGNQN